MSSSMNSKKLLPPVPLFRIPPPYSGMTEKEREHLSKTTGKLRSLNPSELARMKLQHDMRERAKNFAAIRDSARLGMMKKESERNLLPSEKQTAWEKIQRIISKKRLALEESSPTSFARRAAAAKKLKTNGTNVGGNSKIYIGPKNGKFIIKNGSKIYIDNKTLTNNVQYKKRQPKKNNTF